jgi:hypothetical protein
VKKEKKVKILGIKAHNQLKMLDTIKTLDTIQRRFAARTCVVCWCEFQGKGSKCPDCEGEEGVIGSISNW